MPSKQARLVLWLAERAGGEVSVAEFDALTTFLAPISESDLRNRLRSAAVPLHPLVAGVNQDSLETLRDTLLTLARLYDDGSPEVQKLARRIVVTAKDHAKLAAHNQRVAPQKRQTKAEMVVWLLTWLENPGVFALWVAMRRKALSLA